MRSIHSSKIMPKLTVLALSISMTQFAFANESAVASENQASTEDTAVQTLATIVVVGSSEKAGGDLLKQPLSASVITERQL